MIVEVVHVAILPREVAQHVRFTPDSGHSSVQVGCPKSAISGHLQKQGAGTSSQRVNPGQVRQHRRSPLGAAADVSRPEARPARSH